MDKISRKTRVMTTMAILLAMTVVLSIVEHSLPALPLLPPNVRLGLSNVIVMYTMFFLGRRYALGMAVLKSIFVMLTRGAVAGFMSLLGGLTSVVIMIILVTVFKERISYLGLSVAGALGHNIGQMVGASLQLQQNLVKLYWPVLLVAGVLFGVVTGILLQIVMPIFNRISGLSETNSKNRSYDYFLFDLDNTLFDFNKSQQVAMEELFADHGFELTPEVKAEYKHINERMWAEYEKGNKTQQEVMEDRFAELKDQFGLELDPKEFNKEYLYKLGKGNHMLDGTEELIHKLKANGKKVYIVTNGETNIQYSRIALSPIKDELDGIYISEEIGYKKPQPEFFEYVLNAIGIKDRNKVLIIGDRLSADIKGANSVNIDSCWLNPNGAGLSGDAKPTYEVDCVSKIGYLLN